MGTKIPRLEMLSDGWRQHNGTLVPVVPHKPLALGA